MTRTEHPWPHAGYPQSGGALHHRYLALDLSLIDIAALIIVLIATVLAFAHVDRIAVWLLLPYLAWVSFASMSNLSLW